MSGSVLGWAIKRSSLFQEIGEVSIFVKAASRSGQLGVVSPDGVGEELGEPVVRDLLSFSEFLFFLLDSSLKVTHGSVLQRLLSSGPHLSGLVLGLEFFVVNLVHQELVRVLVVTDKLELSVGLVDESSLATVLDSVGWGLGGQRNEEEFSESEDECLLLNG